MKTFKEFKERKPIHNSEQVYFKVSIPDMSHVHEGVK